MTALILTTLGAFGAGFWVPEFAAAVINRRIPVLANWWCGTSAALLAAGLMLR